MVDVNGKSEKGMGWNGMQPEARYDRMKLDGTEWDEIEQGK